MIFQFVRGMDLRTFREDPKTVAAVERKLLLISEGATRLGEDAERLCPDLPWHNIRGLVTGSGIAMTEWMSKRCGTRLSTVFRRSSLPPLKSGVLRALAPPPANPKVSEPG